MAIWRFGEIPDERRRRESRWAKIPEENAVNGGGKVWRLAGWNGGEIVQRSNVQLLILDSALKCVILADFRRVRVRRVGGVITDMELWSEVRRRVLTGKLTKRAACREYEIHWQTLAKMLQHVEPPGYRQTKARPSKLDAFLPVIHEILIGVGRFIGSSDTGRSESSNDYAMSMVTTAGGLW